MILFLAQLIANIPPFLWVMMWLCIGLCVGSFINVLIFRLPIMLNDEHTDLSLSLPRSFCPTCKHTIVWYDNIPCLSYLLLKAQCRHCKTPINKNYFLVELITGVLTMTLAYHYGTSLTLVWTSLFICFLIPMIIIDSKHFLLPDQLTLGLLWIGLLINLQHIFTSLSGAVIGAAYGYGLLAFINYVYFLIRKRHGMGQGDWKLLAAFGAWFGPLGVSGILILACFLASVFAIGGLVTKKAHLQTMIPFGPFLCFTAALWLLFYPSITPVIHLIYA